MHDTPHRTDASATILVVDDEPGIRLLLETVLAAEGFRVVTAENGIDALQVVESAPPSVVVTDLMMPALDGYGLIERLRTANVPMRGIIAMSAASVAGTRPPGADLFVAKPFDIEHIIASVFALLADPLPDQPAP
jgi:CheY-like chemotaxis protein